MTGEIAAAGALVLLAKNLVDTIKGLGDVLRASRRNEREVARFKDLLTQVDKYNHRLGDLARQLEQSERLTRQVPAWLEVANRMPLWQTSDQLEMRDIKKLDEELRQFVFDSVQDHFSATFFHTDFSALPDVVTELKIFRSFLTEFDKTLSAVPRGNVEAFRSLWSSLATQFTSLTNKAWELRRLAEELQGQLVRELVESAQEAGKLQNYTLEP